MSNTCFPLVRGRVMRATRLDECGRVKDSGCSSITTKGFVSVALTANITEAEAITVVNANGEQCVNDTGNPSFGGYGVAVTFCNVDPELYAMMTNQEVVYDSAGDAVGFRMSTGVDISKANFALEVWSNVPGVACGVVGGSFGYTLLPFISGGIIGDFTLENAAVSFVLQNAATKDGTQWGTGPHDVVANGGTNEKQTVTITGTPTGGSFTLTYSGQTTAAIAYNAAAAVVQTALENLSNIAPGDVAVTGGPGPGTPYVVTFTGDLGQADVAQMTATGSFTGGTTPAVAVTTTVPGVAPTAGPLLKAMGVKDHLHVQLTTIDPPEPGCACLASGPQATGATAGSPGTWTPVDAYPPKDFTDLTDGSPVIVASPATAWTSGQHVVLEDDSHAYWNATAWVAGEAP